MWWEHLETEILHEFEQPNVWVITITIKVRSKQASSKRYKESLKLDGSKKLREREQARKDGKPHFIIRSRKSGKKKR